MQDVTPQQPSDLVMKTVGIAAAAQMAFLPFAGAPDVNLWVVHVVSRSFCCCMHAVCKMLYEMLSALLYLTRTQEDAVNVAAIYPCSAERE